MTNNLRTGKDFILNKVVNLFSVSDSTELRKSYEKNTDENFFKMVYEKFVQTIKSTQGKESFLTILDEYELKMILQN